MHTFPVFCTENCVNQMTQCSVFPSAIMKVFLKPFPPGPLVASIATLSVLTPVIYWIQWFDGFLTLIIFDGIIIFAISRFWYILISHFHDLNHYRRLLFFYMSKRKVQLKISATHKFPLQMCIYPFTNILTSIFIPSNTESLFSNIYTC